MSEQIRCTNKTIPFTPNESKILKQHCCTSNDDKNTMLFTANSNVNTSGFCKVTIDIIMTSAQIMT